MTKAISRSAWTPHSPSCKLPLRLNRQSQTTPRSDEAAVVPATKKAGRSGGGFERPGWRSPPGRRVKSIFYMDDGVAVAAAGVLLSTVLVIRRTSTRRLSARPLEVLFDSTGLSLPSPIT